MVLAEHGNGGSGVTPIHIQGEPSDIQRKMFRAAKSQLHVADLLKFVEASPGCGRVISFAGKPDFACDYAIVKTENQGAITDVLAWYLELQFDRRAHSLIDWLTEAFGGRVKEVPND